MNNSPASPLATVDNGDINGALSALRADGAVRVRGFIGTDTVDSINAELEPHVSARGGGFRGANDDFYGSNTVRIQGLARKSRTFVDNVLLNPTLLGVADGFLLPTCGTYWMSQAETIFIGPGSDAQPLHRDDLNWSIAARMEVDFQVSALVALGDYDAEVGATVINPGSHEQRGTGPVPAELEPGDAILYSGRVLHGGGANRTADRWRRALYVGMIASWLTPEEAVAASIDAEFAATLPPRARQLLGWADQSGNPEGSGNRHATALKLWQMDAGDVARTDGVFLQD